MLICQYSHRNTQTLATMRLVLIFLLLLSLTASSTLAVDFQVTNAATGTAGGTVFDNKIGLDYSKQVLSDASSFIWNIFNEAPQDRKDVDLITLTIDPTYNGVAETSANNIRVSSDYIAGYSGDVKTEITGVLYHETTHVWQWNGQGQANGGLIEGIADYVRLKANYAPDHWVKPGEGNKWDQGYDVTARFLDYCDSVVKNGFVAELNGKMKDGYSDDFFQELLGKSVDQLWSDYKAYYGMS